MSNANEVNSELAVTVERALEILDSPDSVKREEGRDLLYKTRDLLLENNRVLVRAIDKSFIFNADELTEEARMEYDSSVRGNIQDFSAYLYRINHGEPIEQLLANMLGSKVEEPDNFIFHLKYMYENVKDLWFVDVSKSGNAMFAAGQTTPFELDRQNN